MAAANYRNKHIITIIIAVQVLSIHFFDLKGIALFVMLLIFSFLIGLFIKSGKFEKQDELTKENVRKSNTITLAVILTVLVIMGIIGGNIKSSSSISLLAENAYYYIAAGAVMLRSAVFLLLDSPLKCDEVKE